MCIRDRVNTGQLDLVLTKPFSSQFLLSFRRLSFEELGSFLAAQSLLVMLVLTGHLHLSAVRVAGFIIALFVSFAIVYSVFLCFLALGIWLERLDNMADLLWSMFGLCRYPADIFPPWLKRLFWSVAPIAFVTTVPARALLRGEQPAILAGGVLIAVTGLWMSRVFWRWSLAGYTSAGG